MDDDRVLYGLRRGRARLAPVADWADPGRV